MTEQELERRGYEFTGKYDSGPDGKQRMLAAAGQLRREGWQATVFHKVYQGRITSSYGYSVYKRKKVTVDRLKSVIGARVRITVRAPDAWTKPTLLEGILERNNGRWLCGGREFLPRAVDIVTELDFPKTNTPNEQSSTASV